MQGFLASPPLAVAQAATYLAAHRGDPAAPGVIVPRSA
jgi:hypothetical protein